MSELTASDFSTYFESVHGHPPFPWQQRLTEEVLTTGKWPEVIDLPTGVGKTATLDTAVFCLAADPFRFPRRIVFVIDRRIVVDQVYERAETINEAIHQASVPVLGKMKEQLSQLTDGKPLGAVSLRGGIPIDQEWAERPDQPWVMVSTVDQFGSRLLFRGYGVSDRMRPVHAGLAGNDCLVILDEVHLSRPFAETLNSITKVHTGLPRRFQVVQMSATPVGSNEPRFSLKESDLDNSPELAKRVLAVKNAELVTVGKAREEAYEAMPIAVSKLLKSDVPEQFRSVGVIVNRVRTAREVFRKLKAERYSVHLITGRMRPLDRVRALESIETLVDPERPADSVASRTVVVATQSIEVGADFSFDALITECAPIDSLKQRFGRLDRRGFAVEQLGQPARAWIIGIKSDIESKNPDPIYGEAARRTWEFLKQSFDEDVFDVGPRSPDLLNPPPETMSPKRQAPLLLATHLEAWVQTNPEPLAQPPIGPFLHGMDIKPNADVSIVWRWDASKEALSLVPPRPTEQLDIPISAAKAWLAGSKEIPVADTDQAPGFDDEVRGEVLRWDGFEKGATKITIERIEPGNILIVSPEEGGLSGGTWDPSATDPVTDLGDQSQWEYHKTVTLRLDPRVLPPDVPSVPKPDSETNDGTAPSVQDWLTGLGERKDWLGKAAKELSASKRRSLVSVEPHPPSASQRTKERLGNEGVSSKEIPSSPNQAYDLLGNYIVLSSPRKNLKSQVDPRTLDGSDISHSFTGTGAKLEDHLKAVGKRARDMAARLGLSEDLQTDLEIAGRLHDIGKIDERFQLQLVGGDLVARAMLDAPLAKSKRGTPRVFSMPKGMRHEIAGLAMISSSPSVLEEAKDKDLVLHLVATHHGYGRPLPPIIEDPEPVTLKYEINGSTLESSSQLVDTPIALEVADRFWKLIQKYGYFGVAWLEAILRLADHRQSAEEGSE